MATLQTLVDAFSSDDTASTWPGSFGTHAIASGVATVTGAAGTSALDTGSTYFDLTNSYVYAKITPAAGSGGAGSVRQALLLQNQATNGTDLRAEWDDSGTITWGQRGPAYARVGADSTKISAAGTAFWVAFAEGAACANFGAAQASGTVGEYWSADGVTWSLIATRAKPSWVTTCKVQLLSSNSSGTSVATFDNLNTGATLGSSTSVTWPKMATLIEAFTADDTSTKWPGAFGTHSISGGVGNVSVAAGPSTSGFDSGVNLYDLTNSYVLTKVTPTKNTGTAVKISLLLQNGVTTGSDLRATWDDSGTITFGERTGSFTTVGTNVTKSSADGVAYYVAIAEGSACAKFGSAQAQGVIGFFWSADTVTWTLMGTNTTPTWATAAKVQLLVQNTTGASSAVFDNVNNPPTALLTPGVPSAPTTVAAVRGTDTTTATVTWAAPTTLNGSAVSSYTVTRTGLDASGVNTETHTVSATAFTYTFSNLLPGAPYSFIVAAVNGYGPGPSVQVNITAATTTGLPLASILIDTFSGTVVDSTKWSTPTGGVTEAGGTLNISGDSYTGSDTLNGGDFILSIPVDYTGASLPVDLVSVADAPGAITEYRLQSVDNPLNMLRIYITNGTIVAQNREVSGQPGGSVSYGFTAATMKTVRIRHSVSLGVVTMEYSTDKQTWVGLGSFQAPIWLSAVRAMLRVYTPVASDGGGGTVAAAPGVPTSVSRSTTGATATITWSPPVSDGGSPVLNYVVARDGVDVNGYGSYSTTVSASNTGGLTVTFNNLAPGTLYNLSVQAVNAVGAGPVSTASITTSGSVVTPPTGGGTSGSGSYDDFARSTPMGPSAPSGKTWGLRFADDFVGTTLSSHWIKAAPDGTGANGGKGWGEETYVASQVAVANSLVTLTMSPPVGGARPLAGVICSATGNANQIAMKPGDYLEAYIKVPPAADGNMWPAWWGIGVGTPGSNGGNGSGVGWPPEIDFFEFGYGAGAIGNTNGKPKLSYHFGKKGSTLDGGSTYGSGDYRGAFHNYGILWDAATHVLTAYIDGVSTGHTQSIPTYTDISGRGEQQVLPQCLIFSHQIQDTNLTAPSYYQMDWCRLWTPQ